MNHIKITPKILLLTGTLLLVGCTSSIPTASKNKDFPASPGAFVYEGRNFGTNRNENYKLGVKDGCDTSRGIYKKSHAQFNGNNSYRIGWEHGRIHCNPNDRAKYESLVGK